MPEVQFGPYTLVKRIAVGGMAEVYLARVGEGPNEREVVVKQILPQLAEEPELLQLFFDEARIASRVVHPGIVRIIDVGEHDGVHFLAMEYVDGLDLSQLLRFTREMWPDRPFPIGQALRIAIDLSLALHSVHEAAEPDGAPLEIVHRDVSPQNVLISRKGEVKLGDFGIARARIRAKKTATGVLRGKIAYVSPEQYLGQRGDRRVDVYAIGVVLFEMLAGRRPFVGDEALMIREIMTQDAPSLASIAAGIDVRISSIVALALARRPEDRIPNAAALADAIEALRLAKPQSTVSELALAALAHRDRAAQDAAPARAPRPTQTLAGPADIKPVPRPTETLPVVREDPNATKILPKSDPKNVALLQLADTLPMPAVKETIEEPETVHVARPLSAPQLSVPVILQRHLFTARNVFLMIVALGFAGGWFISTMGDEPKKVAVHRLEEVVVPTATVAEAEVAKAEREEVDADPNPGPSPGPGPGPDPDPDPGPDPETIAPVETIDAPSPPDEPRKTKRRTKTKRATPVAVARDAPPIKPDPPPPAAQTFGELNLDSVPWSHVHLGGRLLGTTPLANVRLPAGKHRFYLENPEQKMSRSVTLTIKTDQELAVRIRLQDGQVERR